MNSRIRILSLNIGLKSDLAGLLTLILVQKGAFIVGENDCARLLRRLGLDPNPGVHVEGVQICPTRRGVILITLKDDVQVENYCRYDVFEITESGIRSTMVKPAGKKEVVVTVKGIHPNTRDSVVLDYLSKFGKVVSTKVVHGVYSSGPLKGMKNGDRAYKIEVKPGENIGTYHVIESQKVSLKYPGQQQTCGHCHETPRSCKGKGIAKRCRAEGGERVEFTDYILSLWKRIGYSPQNLELIDDVNENTEDIHVLQVEAFTPVKARVDDAVFAGVHIKQLPREYDQGEVIEFLCRSGLPENKRDEAIFNTNGSITIKNLDNDTSRVLIEAIHGQYNFDKKLFCNGLVPLTPRKEASSADKPGSISATPPRVHPVLSSAPPGQQGAEASQQVSVVPANSPLTGHPISPSSTSKEVSGPPYVNIQDSFTPSSLPPRDFLGRKDLVRRHSLSMIDRSPPPNSLAAELLGSKEYSWKTSSKSILSNIADIQDSLSDFNSCVESTNDRTSSSDEAETGKEIIECKTANDKKREKKRKRKLAVTPEKEQFLKKQDLKRSPQ